MTVLRGWTGIVTSAALLAVGLAAGCNGEQVSSVRFQATIYEVQLAEGKTIDMDELKAAVDSDSALRRYQAKKLYHVDQVIDLTTESRVSTTAKAPFVTGMRISSAGVPLTTVEYQNVGAVFRIEGRPDKPAGPKQVNISLDVALSALGDSAVALAPSVNAVVLREAKLRYDGPVSFSRPFFVMSEDASVKSRSGKTVAYIGRMILTP